MVQESTRDRPEVQSKVIHIFGRIIHVLLRAIRLRSRKANDGSAIA